MVRGLSRRRGGVSEEKVEAATEEEVVVEEGKPSYEELRMQFIGVQAMLPELQDHVSKLSGRAAELAGLLAQERTRLAELRKIILNQAEMLGKKEVTGKGNTVELKSRRERVVK
jgi:hypothetical protein